ncbi:MAG: peptidylprolyl isomerase [Humidesulfovibrio sp.]|uniref:peptidylprolyl isomerase n=1 Tax=Humidesulfovibrio sp. TaxID=2910988 RepID=UPI0027374FCA|nr:peptidylprolyl isomerase [Humidesulfovibrio sp.]MDP2848746.1 peptidylprolyl isomerase [Humidesulfovibrio sp.]
MINRRSALIALVLVSGLLTALFLGMPSCSRRSQDEVGVVARVNGKPITLELLEFQYDLLHFNALSGELPSVGALRESYGEILGQLIAQELVAQELAKRGQEVSDEELAEAESKVRADYPDDTFEQTLVEEFIDHKMWRKQLRYVCGIEKFQRLVLRPGIHLDYREVEAYYREHLAAFRLPERVRVLVVRAPERALVEKALGLYRQQKSVAGLADAFPGMQVREVIVARDLLTPAWTDALHGSGAVGQGAILTGRAGFEGLILLERLGAETLDIAQAYPQVEAALLEERLQQAFDAWLGKALDASVVLVSERLMHKKDDEELPPEPAVESPGEAPGEDDGQRDVASGNETG